MSEGTSSGTVPRRLSWRSKTHIRLPGTDCDRYFVSDHHRLNVGDYYAHDRTNISVGPSLVRLL